MTPRVDQRPAQGSLREPKGVPRPPQEHPKIIKKSTGILPGAQEAPGVPPGVPPGGKMTSKLMKKQSPNVIKSTKKGP